MSDNKYLTEDEKIALHPDNLAKYEKAERYCKNENAGGYDGWCTGHALLVELGWTRTKRDAGVRSFVGVLKPDNIEHLKAPIIPRNGFDKKVDDKMVFDTLGNAQRVLAEWIVPNSEITDEMALNSLLGILDNRNLVVSMRNFYEDNLLYK